MMDFSSDLFFDLCKHAEQQEWCANLLCSTCGHTSFRYGLLELSYDKTPKKHGWLTNGKWPKDSIEHYKNTIDVINIKGKLQESLSLHNKIKNCKIASILKGIQYPKNINMLEIALFYTEVIENSQLTISKSWRVQFSEYFTKKNGTLDYEVDSLLHSKEIISWKDLELLKLFMA